MRLHILCEDEYGESILPTFLETFTTGFTKVSAESFKGSGNLVRDLIEKSEILFKGDKDKDLYVLAMVDVKEFPIRPPKSVWDSENPLSAMQTWITRYFVERIPSEFSQRFIMHPTLMELETWILADIQSLAGHLGVKKDVLERSHSPESIDDPTIILKKVIERFLPRKTYVKSQSPSLFKKISAQNVYDDNCPAFVRLVDELLVIQGLKAETPKPDYVFRIDESPDCARLRQEIEARLEAVVDDDAELEEIMRLEAQYRANC